MDFFIFLLQFVEELSSMTCWATNHKWRFAQTGSALIELTGTMLRLVGAWLYMYPQLITPSSPFSALLP